MNWYAVMTKPQKEALADLNLRWLGYETYFVHDKKRPRSAKSKLLPHLTRVAYFPRYVFVRSEQREIAGVRDAIGVSGLVAAPGGNPAEFPDDVMDGLFKKLGRDGVIDRPKATRRPRFLGKHGQFFRFGETSPFFGFYAQIVQVLDNERLVVKLQQSLFGAAGRELDVPIADVGELEPLITTNG